MRSLALALALSACTEEAPLEAPPAPCGDPVVVVHDGAVLVATCAPAHSVRIVTPNPDSEGWADALRGEEATPANPSAWVARVDGPFVVWVHDDAGVRTHPEVWSDLEAWFGR